MSIFSVLLICLCIGVEAFWTGFYLKCHQLSFSKLTVVLAYLGSLIVCIPFLYLGISLRKNSDPQLCNQIAGLIFGVLGTLSLTQNIKRTYDDNLRSNLRYYAYSCEENYCIKCVHAFFTGMVSSFSALLACIAFGILNISSPLVCILISAVLVLSLIWGSRTSNKMVLFIIDGVLKYLPGCILAFIGILKFF